VDNDKKLMEKFIIQTTRLSLRQLTADDAMHFYELNNDPEVIRYTGDLPFNDPQDAHHFLERYNQYEKYGYGRWAVILKQTGEFIGWCGLKFEPELAETDLGFRFFKRHWNKGYATEAATACVRHGFEVLHLKRMVGRAMEENAASVRVLEKAGFHFLKKIEFEKHPGLLFYLDSYELEVPM
jgi:RimJ/RimL family protein N-acetyltransferase